MKLAYRLAYFSGGFLIGILLLFFILSGKKNILCLWAGIQNP